MSGGQDGMAVMKCIGALILLAATPAFAAVKSQTETSFDIVQTVTTKAPPARAYAALRDVGHWWDGAHSFSHNALNLRFDLRAGGCLCETLPGGGGVEHLHIAAVLPQTMVILHGGMGPLLPQAVSGAMTISFKPAGAGTEITWRYAVSGAFDGGAAKWAGPVDGVIGAQAARLARYTDTGRPTADTK